MIYGKEVFRAEMANGFAATCLGAYTMPDAPWPNDEALAAIADVAVRLADKMIERLERRETPATNRPVDSRFQL